MKLFRRPSVRYGRTPAPETPYQKAGQVWDERIGSARVQARNWRLFAFGNLVLAGGLALGLIWQHTRGAVTPSRSSGPRATLRSARPGHGCKHKQTSGNNPARTALNDHGSSILILYRSRPHGVRDGGCNQVANH